jgi:NAD(P)-dependent dehydrogenase (short-subunit alcohol dehydrogenase family)
MAEEVSRRTMLSLTAAAVAGSLTACTQQAHPVLAATPARRRFAGKIVAFCGRREALGQAVEKEIRSKGAEASYIRADVRVENDVQSVVDGVAARYGRIDIAFNNAGITLEKPLHQYTSAEWEDIVHTNLRGVFLAMKYEIPHMLAAGGGNIVVTSSSNAIATTAHRSAYAASKRGLVGLVQSAALDYASNGIRVNALIPGTTDTALVRRVAHMEGAPDAVWELGAHAWGKHNIPMGRMATPEEIASFALALASDDFPFMTGAQMVIDGGKTAQAG